MNESLIRSVSLGSLMDLIEACESLLERIRIDGPTERREAAIHAALVQLQKELSGHADRAEGES